MPIVTRNIKDGAVTAAKLGSDVVNSFSVDDATVELDSTTLQVKAGGIGGAQLGTGWLKVSLVDGQDETTGPDLTYTLTGAADGDEVVSVIHISTKASIATMAVLTGYTITGTNELTSGSAVDLSNDQLMVTWIDHTP